MENKIYNASFPTKFIGKHIIKEDITPSTNDLAKKLANENAADGTLVIAAEQNAGRGRLTRGWYSPKGGGLWFSLILRPTFVEPADAPKFTLLTAVAAVRAINKCGASVGIKWPNDILSDGKKLAGILTEINAAAKINYIVVGMGINTNIAEKDFPDELKNIATSLSIITEKNVDNQNLLAALLVEFEKLYLSVKTAGFTDILNEWRQNSVTLGHEVNVFGINEEFHGIAKDIDDDGTLLVSTSDGIRRVLAGDVSIRNRGIKQNAARV